MKESAREIPSPLLSPALMDEVKGVRTFVTTRHGGVSQGAYASFNCSPYSGDDTAPVIANMGYLRRLLGGFYGPFLIPRQIHAAKVRVIDKAYLDLPLPAQRDLLVGIDAMVTDQRGCALCVTTADCLPLFFYDPRHQVAGIAHSGWRGTVRHIALEVLQTLQAQYGSRPEELRIAFGPCISWAAFEVGEEVYEAFRSEGYRMEQIALRHPKTGKWHISLQEAVFFDLLQAGVQKGRIEASPHCTYTQEKDFFSARRLGIRSGRILSGIILP